MFTKWCRAFPGVPQEVAGARHFVAAILDGWGGVDDAVLVVGELAANAVRHSRSGALGGWFMVSVDFGGDVVRIEVADQGGDDMPRLHNAMSQAEGGRGLLLVAAYAQAWGTRQAEKGCAVWADVARVDV
ncbi:ATP-binding protein (plasmid) [Streptomyces sp. CWNU-52B]|uniref:ATP-binding protein n=1 Tax=unclassified Streptomyces TaxID=2593676 RepID=UPI0039BED838